MRKVCVGHIDAVIHAGEYGDVEPGLIPEPRQGAEMLRITD